MNSWVCCEDKGATEKIFRVVGREYFCGSCCDGFGVFYKGRAEGEEKFEHVRLLLCLPGVRHFCPLFWPSFFTLQCVSQCADSRQPKLNAASLNGVTNLSFTLLSQYGTRCLNNLKLLDRNTVGYATTNSFRQ